MKRQAVYILLGLVLLIVGLGAGYAWGTSATPVLPSLVLDQENSYKYLRPLLGIQLPKAIGQAKYAALTSSVSAIAQAEPQDALTRYAFYFKDLNSGIWTGINETDQYDPASMLKVVFALAVYKEEETQPGFSSRDLTYTQSVADIQKKFVDALPTNLVVGQTYSIPYLIEDMLTNSDNGAKDLLVTSLDPALLNKIFNDLLVQRPPSSNTAGFTVSAQDFSRFLRILYYGTYDMSWKNSDNLLADLAASTYKEGLVAGVPTNVPVAHKYGEQLVTHDGTASGIELSDCGIVYPSKNPYLICVMTEGKDEKMLASFIAKVSKATYAAAGS